MKRIQITTEIKNKYKESILKIFKNKNGYLIKNRKNRIEFKIHVNLLDKLIKKKLKKFDKDISFEKLLVADFIYLKKLVDYLDKNSSYASLSEKQKKYFYILYERLNKVEFIRNLNINVCPYCNRNYIFNFKKKKLNATAQLDHFFDKNHYPFLSVSLYNLIPSCPTCNQRKSNKKVDIFNPYIYDIDSFIRFELKIRTSDFYYSTKGFDIDIVPKRNVNDKEILQKINNHIETFNLKYLYNNHKDIILELIQKKYIYNESYLDELYKKYEGTIFRNREDLIRLISCAYVDDNINQRPLSKMIKDISKQLELI